MRQHPALQRPLTGPDHVAREVLMPPSLEPFGYHRIDLRPLPGQNQELLRIALYRFVEDPLDVSRRVQMRLVGSEGAVLAVALAGAREREGEVAGEGNPAHRAKLPHAPRGPGRWPQPALTPAGWGQSRMRSKTR